MDDFRQFLDRLADLEGCELSVYVGGERSGSAPVAIIRGVAGKLDMSRTWAGDDESSSVAFLPLGPDGAGPHGAAGLYFNRDCYERGGGNGNVLSVMLGGVEFNIAIGRR